MTMSVAQSVITIAAVILGTMLTRFLPFIVFRGDAEPPKFVRYLGAVLPYAVMGLLIVYSLRTTNVLGGSHGVPELIAVAVVVALHLWRHNMLLSMIGGTAVYMVLVQVVFA